MRTLLIVLLLLCSSTYSHAVNTIDALNVQRAEFGIYPLINDQKMYEAALKQCKLRSVQHMNGHWGKYCKKCRKNHIKDGPIVGSWEGTARRNSKSKGPAGEYWGAEDVYACYQSGNCYQVRTNATHAGMASYLGKDGYWYYQLQLRRDRSIRLPKYTRTKSKYLWINERGGFEGQLPNHVFIKGFSK